MLGDNFVSNAIVAKGCGFCSTNIFTLNFGTFEWWIVRNVCLDLFIEMSKEAMLVKFGLPFKGSTRAKHTVI